MFSRRVRIGCELSGAKQTGCVLDGFVGLELRVFKCSVEGCELGANCQGPSKSLVLVGLKWV